MKVKNEVDYTPELFKEINTKDIEKLVQQHSHVIVVFYNLDVEVQEDGDGQFNMREASEDFFYVLERCRPFLKQNWQLFKVNMSKVNKSVFEPPKFNLPVVWHYVYGDKLREATKYADQDKLIIDGLNHIGG